MFSNGWNCLHKLVDDRMNGRFTPRWQDTLTLCIYISVCNRDMHFHRERPIALAICIRVHRRTRDDFFPDERRITPRSRLPIQGWSRKPSPTLAKPRKCNRWFSFPGRLSARAIPRALSAERRYVKDPRVATRADGDRLNRDRLTEKPYYQRRDYYSASAYAKCGKLEGP